MDEPFKGLDMKLKGDMISLFIKMWNQSQRTVIFITHDVDEAVNLSHVIYILKNRPLDVVDKLNVDNTSNNREEIKSILLSN